MLRNGKSWLDHDDALSLPLKGLFKGRDSDEEDALAREGKLSVWKVADQDDLDRILAAVATTRNTLANVDFPCFSDERLDDLGVKPQNSPEHGTTADETVNGWHYELTEVSLRRLADLVFLLLESAPAQRKPWKEIEALVTRGIQQGWINIDKVDPTLRSKLRAAGAP